MFRGGLFQECGIFSGNSGSGPNAVFGISGELQADIPGGGVQASQKPRQKNAVPQRPGNQVDSFRHVVGFQEKLVIQNTIGKLGCDYQDIAYPEQENDEESQLKDVGSQGTGGFGKKSFP